jgi:hypothetical protein
MMANRKRRFALCDLCLLLTLAPVFAAGCSMVDSRSDVVGNYRLNTTGGEITLRLSEDGRFSETIVWASGKRETRSGNWNWSEKVLNFDQLWIPREFAPSYIQEADASAKDQPKYTEPGHWTVRPERHWGTIILSIFPDDGENFRMTK